MALVAEEASDNQDLRHSRSPEASRLSRQRGLGLHATHISLRKSTLKACFMDLYHHHGGATKRRDSVVVSRSSDMPGQSQIVLW